jgi:hypothetical protein
VPEEESPAASPWHKLRLPEIRPMPSRVEYPQRSALLTLYNSYCTHAMIQSKILNLMKCSHRLSRNASKPVVLGVSGRQSYTALLSSNAEKRSAPLTQ